MAIIGDPVNKIELHLSKLLHTSGLTRKRVLVRKKGGAPFWSTRWVQEGDTVKETVEAAGYELVAVGGEDPEPKSKVTLKDLVKSALEAGKDAFKNGIPHDRIMSDSKMVELIDQSTGDLIHQLKIREGWSKGWFQAKKIADKEREDNFDMMPDVEPEPEPEPEPTPEPTQYGIPLADRIHKTTKMKVPGVGTTPAIAVRDIQIGDRLQFIEGVYRVKGVIVKGASSTIIFEETDTEGNNLKLKKQNRTMLAVEKTQLKPGGYVPKPETDEPKTVPHWAREKVSKDVVTGKLISTSGDFVPSKTVKEATDRLKHQFLKSGEYIIHFTKSKDFINLDGLKLSELNSIIHGFERTIGKYNIKLDHIGWNDKKQSFAAMYSHLGDHSAILFQKTATKNPKAHQKRSLDNFEISKERNVVKQERYLTYKELSPGHHDDIRERIVNLNELKRWTVDSALDDMLLGTTVHEAHHAIYHENNLRDKWYDNVKRLVGPKLSSEIKCASVSEYGMSQMGELFAEVGVAVEFGVEIDPDVKQAYLDTMEGVK